MKNLISKLNTLKSIEPEENWVVETRKRVLSEAPVLGWKMTEVRNKRENRVVDRFFSRKQNSRDGDLSRLGKYDELRRDKSASLQHINALFSKKLAVSAFSFVFLISGSALTVEASKSSLPGDSLYIIKIATEDVTLAVASKEKRPEIEIGQAGRRLEELAEISKKPSYDDQGKKAEQLLASFEEKINSAQNGLTEIENNGVKAKVAKVINVQTKKYTEVLAETSESLPDVVKVEMSEKFASAVSSNEKVNFESLATMVETVGENEEEKEEITAKVKEKIDELEEKIIINNESVKDEGSEEAGDGEETENTEDSDKNDNDNTGEELINTVDENENVEDGGEDNEDSISEPKTVAEEAKEELEKAKVSLESDNLSEAMEAIMNVNITVDLIDSESEPDPAGEEQGEDRSQGDGEVEGVSDEVESKEGEENVDKKSISE